MSCLDSEFWPLKLFFNCIFFVLYLVFESLSDTLMTQLFSSESDRIYFVYMCVRVCQVQKLFPGIVCPPKRMF